MVKELLSVLLRMTGIPFLVREIFQRRLVTIVVYHRLDPLTAARHFSALRRSYSPISLQTYLNARRNHQTNDLPPKPLIVTIDDGHQSVYRLKDVLAEHRVPVTVFLCSGLVGTDLPFWFSAPGLDSSRVQYLKTVSDDARIAALSAVGYAQNLELRDRESLNVKEIEELNGLVDFQSHTVSHPILPACSDEKATEEIRTSKLQLEAQLDLEVTALAYPNGGYTTREMAIARAAGYECGLTTDPGFNKANSPMYALRRLVIRDDCGVHELVVRSCGVWAALRWLAPKVRSFVSLGIGRRRSYKDSMARA
jgi:peptidoglycan/xylan/chitin deacetylase (PgdA/CDA1 family)